MPLTGLLAGFPERINDSLSERAATKRGRLATIVNGDAAKLVEPDLDAALHPPLRGDAPVARIYGQKGDVVLGSEFDLYHGASIS
jgi:hypothetical protein